MPNHCSAPGCKSNYRGEPYTPVFKLPTAPQVLRTQWLNALHRNNIADLSNIFVCMHHFHPKDIITVDRILQADGNFTERIRARPKLCQNAVPSILPGCPTYFSSEPLPRPTRFVRESKDEELFAQALKLSIEQQAHDTEKYGVHNFSNLLTHISSISLSNKWMAFRSGSELHILMPKLQGHTISIEMRLLVSEDMSVQGFRDNVVIPLSIHMLTDTREIELLFEEIENYSSHESSPNKLVTFEHHVKEALHQLDLSISKLNSLLTDPLTDDVSDLSPYLSRLHFIQCQLANVLVHKNKRKYNVITQAMALKAHLTSPSCYRYLQSLDCLCLPHVKTLQQLYSKIGLESDFTTLLMQLTADFCSKERNLILHMDEIHVNSNVAYTGGRILGYSLESDQPIKTVFAIMASSLYRTWSQVIRLIPCSSNSAGDLFTVVKSVISNIENCDLKVQAICTDNYPLNVNMFKLFSSDGKTLTPTVPHPVNQSRKLFLLFDFVHILKSIRNNWLNLKDYDHTFTYPNPLIFPNYDDVDKIHIARFQDIRILYKSEQSSYLNKHIDYLPKPAGLPC